MNKKFPKRLFITATDTGIGKTFVSAILAQGLNGYYYKPIQSGSITDVSWIKKHTDLPPSQILEEKYVLKRPLSPHLAAMYDKRTISISNIKIPKVPSNSHLIVEGCGGVLVPLNEKDFILDLILHLNMPALIVTRSTLGTINHTLLTIEILRSKNISIFGVVMNGKNEKNKEAIEKYGKVKILAQLEKLKNISPSILKKNFKKYF